MSKRKSIVVVDTARKISKTDQDNEEGIDWSCCFICQTEKTEKLQSTSQALTGDKEQPYRELAKRIMRFDSMEMLPVTLDLDKLKGGVELSDSLISHGAKFHKSCKLKFAKERLEKAVRKYEKSKKTERGSS